MVNFLDREIIAVRNCFRRDPGKMLDEKNNLVSEDIKVHMVGAKLLVTSATSMTLILKSAMYSTTAKIGASVPMSVSFANLEKMISEHLGLRTMLMS